MSQWVEMMGSAAAASLRLGAANFALARNFHQAALIPRLADTGAPSARSEERQSVIEIERDGRVGIDLKFGSITFKKQDEKTFAVALVDVIVDGAPGPSDGTRVQMEVKVAANPEADPILDITERCRAQIVANLRAAADRFDALSAPTLLFDGAE